MKRFWFWGASLALILSWAILSGSSARADVADLVPVHPGAQPSSIGDFTGIVGVAHFSVAGKKNDNWTRFLSHLAFMQGMARDKDGIIGPVELFFT